MLNRFLRGWSKSSSSKSCFSRGQSFDRELHILLHSRAEFLLELISKVDVLALCIINRSTFQCLSVHVCRLYFFKYPYKYSYFMPQKIRYYHFANSPTMPMHPTITKIVFSDNFNLPLAVSSTSLNNEGGMIIIPESTTCISFGHSFNQSIKELQHLPRLSHLSMGYLFNQPVDELPSSLACIHFGHCFNQSVARLPSRVLKITFGPLFTQPLDKLPPSLTHLNFIGVGAHPINLPSSVTHLSFSSSSDFYFGTDLHTSPPPITALPPKLSHLILYEQFNQALSPTFFPQTLTTLTFGAAFNRPVNCLPNSLLYLTFGASFNCSLPSVLPLLISLSFGDSFNQPLVLPNTLVHLTFGYSFNQSLLSLPPSLQNLVLGFSFHHPLPQHLPSRLRLTLDPCFPHKIPEQASVTPLNESSIVSLFDTLKRMFPQH